MSCSRAISLGVLGLGGRFARRPWYSRRNWCAQMHVCSHVCMMATCHPQLKAALICQCWSRRVPQYSCSWLHFAHSYWTSLRTGGADSACCSCSCQNWCRLLAFSYTRRSLSESHCSPTVTGRFVPISSRFRTTKWPVCVCTLLQRSFAMCTVTSTCTVCAVTYTTCAVSSTKSP
jgi:hypothetical protein